MNSRFHPDVPRRVSYGPPLFRGRVGITMEEWRAIVVLRRPELLELEAILPVASRDWDVECMGNDRGGAAGLQHLRELTLPRIRAFWSLDVYAKVRQRTGTVDERYVPFWWKPSPDKWEYADRMPAGALLCHHAMHASPSPPRACHLQTPCRSPCLLSVRQPTAPQLVFLCGVPRHAWVHLRCGLYRTHMHGPNPERHRFRIPSQEDYAAV